jgi:uncharacterized protein (TIGR02284 family)
MTDEVRDRKAVGTLEKLQSLIQINLDSEKSFVEAAGKVDNEEIKSTFLALAKERARNADALREAVSYNQELPRDEGSYVGTFHRIWVDILSTLNGGDVMTILAEAERGEDYIKKLYEEVIRETERRSINDLVSSQYLSIQAGHQRIRELRDIIARDH